MVALWIALGGSALADGSIPDAATAEEVTALPRAGELRVWLSLSQFEGCSMSSRSEQEEVALTLRLDGAGGAELTATGTQRSVAGGRTSVDEPPRVYRDDTRRVAARWAGRATVERDLLSLTLGSGPGGIALACRVERVARDGDGAPGRDVGALVCRREGEVRGLPLGTLTRALEALPFGRSDGYRVRESGHRFAAARPRAPHVELARR